MSSIFWIYLSQIGYSGSFLSLGLAGRKTINHFFQNWIIKESADRTSDAVRRELLMVSAMAGTLVLAFGVILGMNIFSVVLIAAIAAVMTPRLLAQHRRRIFEQAFDDSLIEALTSISASLKAGLTLRESLEISANTCPDPYRREMAMAMSRYQFGVPLDVALDDIRKRVRTANSAIAFGAMIVSHRVGGNLPLVLQRLASTIRERFRAQAKLKSLTAQGTTQSYLLCAAPLGVALLMYVMDPRRIELLVNTTLGQVLLLVAVILELVGIIITRKILDLDI